MRLISVYVPEIYLEGLDELVKKGMYKDRSEAIRVAIRDLLKRELWSNNICRGSSKKHKGYVVVLNS